VIKNVNCSWDELRLRDCPYSNYTISHSCSSGGIAGVRCKTISKIEFAAVNNSVLITWEYSKSHQPSSFDVRCYNGQRRYTNIIPVSSGTSRVSDTVGDLLPNVSYDCCVLAVYAQSSSIRTTDEIRCASIRSEDLLTSTNTFIISDTCANMTATVVVGAMLGCIIVALLIAMCGGALFHLLRSRTSGEVPKR
jgi:hypothetical protein